jgi:hypothetical protein
MLTIRKEQMAVLQQAMETRFEKWLAGQIRAGYPQETKELDDNVMQERIRHGIARIEGYGIRDEESVAGYVELTFKIGSDFEDRPDMSWARRILDDPAIAANEKIPLIDKLSNLDS